MPNPSLVYAHPSGGRLYLSGRHFEAAAIDALGVTAVLSAAEPPSFLAGVEGVERLECRFDDRDGVRPDSAQSRAAVRSVAAHVASGGGALVHCAGGHNRSPYLAGLVLRELGLTGEEAVCLMLERHSRDILTNDSLARALMGRAVRPAERGRRR